MDSAARKGAKLCTDRTPLEPESRGRTTGATGAGAEAEYPLESMGCSWADMIWSYRNVTWDIYWLKCA